jgi:deoxyribodipyrimidine photo-lyase
MVKSERVQIIKEVLVTDGPVAYWMSRDQRTEDNWALLFAQELAMKIRQPLTVVFCLATNFPGATLRHYDFMLKGLKEVSSGLKQKNIPFYLLSGNPSEELSRFVRKFEIAHVVTDFDPLKIKRTWKEELADKVDANLYEVDAHNIVPCHIASQKCEFGAYTIRPKIKRLLPSFIDEFPKLETQVNKGHFKFVEPDWQSALTFPKPDNTVQAVTWLKPGAIAATETFYKFLEQKLEFYDQKSNNPNEDAQSNLSPYLHFGHISAQRIALEIMKHYPGNANTESFLEQLIVRRELSDNYCFYNPLYDRFAGFPEWARKSLNAHRMDEREYLYDFTIFEDAVTHDSLWNAAQMEMVKSGKMHGYMRMYWSKKILEWTRSPEEAFDFSIRLNDRFQLDGRDPNGYVGCAWSIGGVHDRAWTERPVYGKIRYMNFNGCKRKFDVNQYITKWL